MARGTTKITSAQQQAAGFSSPREFSDTLARKENTQFKDNTIDTNELETGVAQTKLPESFVAKPDIPTINQEDIIPPVEQSQESKDNDALKRRIFEETSTTVGRGQLEDEAGLAQLQKDKRALENEALQTSERFRADREEIQARSGLTQSQKTATLNAAIREQNSALKDIDVRKFIASNLLTDAQAAVDRKVEILMEEKQARVNGLKFLFDENKEVLTRNEQREFEAKIRKEEREFEKERDEAQVLETLKLQMMKSAHDAGASLSSISNIQAATDAEGVFRASAAFGGPRGEDDLARRSKLLALAKAGDPKAIKELGFDPQTLGEEFSQGEFQAATFAQRIEDTESILSGGRGSFIPFVPKFARSSERRQFENAEKNFITAVLRRESGAAISPEEFKDAGEVYIPKTTDDEQTLVNKARARRVVLQGLENEAGGARDFLSRELGEQPGPGFSGTTSSGINYTIE